ncbi:MAG: heme-binding domain-containing protein [Chitinophagaceae bacterium]
MIKKILVILLVALVIVQFFHPQKNMAAVAATQSITAVYPVPGNVKEILAASCNDCHSNNTVYPWYAKLQPVDWWLNDHIKEGKKELNFDEFATYSPRRQYRKMEEIIKQVKENEMPLDSYTWIHKEAVLRADQKQLLTQWAESIQKVLQQKYPVDSLVKKK